MVRRYGDKKMHVVLGNMPLDDLNIHRFADLSDQFPQPSSHSSDEHRLAIFRDPYQMVLDVINRMRGLAIILHNFASLLKSSPKGEGFSPIPRRGH